jgi:ubiquinone/menaquinone biosynthesis C-methylase UbiE
MNTQDAYNNWSETYDHVLNKTRDLEAIALRSVLNALPFQKVLELGCGTGKNTGWLAGRAEQLIAADFSRHMLDIAKEKYPLANIMYTEADITASWAFPPVDLVTCSLVLEHIQDLDFIFHEATATLLPNGKFYICELHPYKQLNGSRAKFEKDGMLTELEYFIHHVSDFTRAANNAGLQLSALEEWFDDNDRNQPPRLISFLFTKP